MKNRDARDVAIFLDREAGMNWQEIADKYRLALGYVVFCSTQGSRQIWMYGREKALRIGGGYRSVQP